MDYKPFKDCRSIWKGSITGMFVGGILLTLAASLGVGSLRPCWRPNCKNSKTAEWLGPVGMVASLLAFIGSILGIYLRTNFSESISTLRRMNGPTHYKFLFSGFVTIAVFSSVCLMIYITELSLAEVNKKSS